MRSYQHDLESVQDYLHHRLPWLLVESIDSISRNEIVTSRKIAEDDFFLQGHFPGAPIVPGSMLQEFSTQTAGILIAAQFNPMREYNTTDPFFNEYALGVLVRVKSARYKSFARPGDQLQARVSLVESLDNLFDFRATISANGAPIMRNQFQLANIKSSMLQGE